MNYFFEYQKLKIVAQPILFFHSLKIVLLKFFLTEEVVLLFLRSHLNFLTV